jgi:hypothetical protein
VPAYGGALVTPDRAILAPPARVPSGLVAVAPAVAEDSRVRAFLVDVLGVREMSEEVWEEVLSESLAAASVSGEAGHWQTFWANMSEAPRGEFRPRDELVVLERVDREGVPTGLILDDAFHAVNLREEPLGSLVI